MQSFSGSKTKTLGERNLQFDKYLLVNYVDKGWKGSNMTCVNRFKTDTPLVTDAIWRYWDLEKLAQAIRNKRRLPEEIAKAHHSFDIAFLWLGELSKNDSLLVCRYLVRSDGYIWC